MFHGAIQKKFSRFLDHGVYIYYVIVHKVGLHEKNLAQYANEKLKTEHQSTANSNGITPNEGAK